MVTSPKGLGPEKDYAGEGQQHIQKTDPSSRQKECYIRIMTAGVQLEKKMLNMSLKGLGAKTNCLAVYRQP
jgi:hypothetical protein